jgi:hypothetical protein
MTSKRRRWTKQIDQERLFLVICSFIVNVLKTSLGPFAKLRRTTINFVISSRRKANKMQQCIKILFYIYMKLNMFRATHRPSSGA